MADITEMLDVANRIKTESQVGGNTAVRVGGLFVDVVELLDTLSAYVERLNELNIGVDVMRGVLRIGEKYYKLIAYEGEVEIDDDFDYMQFVQVVYEQESAEWLRVIIDKDNRILWGLWKDGTEYAPDLSGYKIDGVSVSRIVNALKTYDE